MSSRRKPTGRIIVMASLGAFAAGGLGLWLMQDTAREGFLAAARLTARWSFLWFIAAWSASSLAKLWPGGWRAALLFNRRGVGLGFAAAHIIHAGFFLIAILGFGAPAGLVTVLGGGLGYLFVIVMALTSNDWSVRALGPKSWKLLHSVGGYYVLGIFAFSYYGRLATKPWLGASALALIGAAILLRIAAAMKTRRAQAPV